MTFVQNQEDKIKYIEDPYSNDFNITFIHFRILIVEINNFDSSKFL